MRIEEIALRQEARQMLAESGLNKETLKELVLKDLEDKVLQAIEKKTKEVDWDEMITRKLNYAVEAAVHKAVDKTVSNYFNRHPLKIVATASFENN